MPRRQIGELWGRPLAGLHTDKPDHGTAFRFDPAWTEVERFDPSSGAAPFPPIDATVAKELGYGRVKACEFPAEFIYENLMIEANIIQAAHAADVQELLFLGSSCIYPKHAEQPMSEEALLTGVLEPTNEPYAIAKIAGIKRLALRR